MAIELKPGDIFAALGGFGWLQDGTGYCSEIFSVVREGIVSVYSDDRNSLYFFAVNVRFRACWGLHDSERAGN